MVPLPHIAFALALPLFMTPSAPVPVRVPVPAGRPVASRPTAAPPAPAPDVKLTVAEESAERWRLRIENTGAVPVRVMADARLLSLDVTPPGAKKAAHCALPADMHPETADERGLVMPPQRAYVESFDPRVYCFGASASALVPGATVVAHLGWPPPAKGRKATAPFEVEPLAGVVPEVGPLRELVTPSWTIAAVAAELPSAASATTEPSGGPPSPPAPEEEGTPSLELTSDDHADADLPGDISVTVTLKNRGARAVTTLVRVETLSFDVIPPDGAAVRCGTPRAVDSPIRELFATLPPKGSASTSVLLSQLCPGRTFDQAGLYLVTAKLDTRRASGRPIGLATFDGLVTATKPTRVRLRHVRSTSRRSRPALE
jgi:hypothetical protein